MQITMKRKERMIRIRKKMQTMIENKCLDLDLLIANAMMAYGVSKRDARDEVNAIVKLEGLS